jgi:AcrR family transcriptional regulator
MSSLDTSTEKLGLRERKKQQTRETIKRVALQLFAERGYDHTTLAEIAEAANVAPRTIFAYFESKEDILLGGEHSFLDDMKRRLDERPAGTTTVDALREFLSTIPREDEDDVLRKKIMKENPALKMKAQAGHTRLEPMLAESIARDLGAKPDDLQPMLAAASVTAAFMSVRDRIFEAEAGCEPMTHEQAMAVLDQVLDFLRGGLEALQQA